MSLFAIIFNRAKVILAIINIKTTLLIEIKLINRIDKL